MPFSLSVALFRPPPPPPTDSPGLNPEIPASESGTHGHVLGYKQRISGLPIMGFVDSDPEEGGGGGGATSAPPGDSQRCHCSHPLFSIAFGAFSFFLPFLGLFFPIFGFFSPIFRPFFPHFPPFVPLRPFFLAHFPPFKGIFSHFNTFSPHFFCP